MLTRIVCLGDLHFRSDQWYGEVFEKWMTWFERVDFGPRDETTLIQLGDPTHKDVVPGDVTWLLKRFVDVCHERFRHTYVLVGNHELKSYKGKLQYSTKWLECEPGFTVVKDEGVLEIGDVKVLALPFKRVRDKTIEAYYDECVLPEYYSTEYDFLVGHLSAKERGLKFPGVDFTRYSTKELCLGHIHTRMKKSEYVNSYVGAVIPLSVYEAEQEQEPRCYRVYEKKDGVLTKKDSPIPQIIQYDEVEYPNPIVRKRDEFVHVYRVFDCRSLSKAKAHYSKNHVFAVEKRKKDEVEVSSGIEVKKFASKLEAMTEMIKETKKSIGRRTYGYLKEILS